MGRVWLRLACRALTERFPSAGRRGENELRVAVAGILPPLRGQNCKKSKRNRIAGILPLSAVPARNIRFNPNEYRVFTVISVGTIGVNEIVESFPF